MRTTFAVSNRTDEVVTRLASRTTSIPAAQTSDIGTAVAALVVLVALFRTNPEDVGDYGLAAAVPIYGLAAFIGLTILALHSTLRPDFHEGRAAATVASVVALLSAAPGIVYETTRFGWAYKHVGVVDYIDRTGSLNRQDEILGIYHNWPGLFTGTASLVQWFGLANALTIATWTPLVLNLLTLGGVVLVGGGLTDSRQNVWLGALLFFAANWIGQDYYSPQALAFVLYLAIVGLVLRYYRPNSKLAPGIAVHLSLVMMISAIAISHQLTPMVLCVALVGLQVTRQIRAMWLPAFALLSTLGWTVLFATPYLKDNLASVFGDFGSPVGNAAETLAKASVRNEAQTWVAAAGRGSLFLILVLAGLALISRSERGSNLLTPLGLLAAPGAMIMMAFGGEILFRVALFMLPVLCLLAAETIRFNSSQFGNWTIGAPVVVTLFLALSLASFGKDNFYTFSRNEVSVVAQLAEVAPPNSLLVEGSRNYPALFSNYENFVYVPIDREGRASQRSIQLAPADEMFRWLDNDFYDAGYILLTRSQQRDVLALGSLPREFLPELEAALRGDPRFITLLDTPEAVVFELRP